jgi:hypothetical protein
MTFDISKNVHVERDPQGRVLHLRHPQAAFTQATGLAAHSPRALAASYVREVAPIYALDSAQLGELELEVDGQPSEAGTRLRLGEVKRVLETRVISYQQTHFGLPIWESGISVSSHEGPLRVTSSVSTVHRDVQVSWPKSVPRGEGSQGDGFEEDTFLREVVAVERGRGGQEVLHSHRLLIYRYEPDRRIDPEAHVDEKSDFEQGPPTLPLAPVPDSIQAGRHYVVHEVLFRKSVPGWGPLNWRAFVEPDTHSVLYLRAFVACATGMVFEHDPLTLTGDATITPTSAAATLDPLRTSVTLEGLDTPAPNVELKGEYVEVLDRESPTDAPPTEAPPGSFSYSAPTDDFAAVNAYHHCDALFRLVEDMGFNMADYFDGTTFPVTVDHKGRGGDVNANAPGNASGCGSDGFNFGVAAAGGVGIAADWRVVLHEFGHTVLWDNVCSPNFGFAHSCGDSLAAILNDPGSLVADRFLSFPWITTTRRHDRAVADGWGWGGANDTGGYNSEQILATTLFRAYLSVGGDSTSSNPATQLARREFAARYMAYLIFRGVASLASAPITPTSTPDVFATALINADTGTASFEGHPGGAFHKVIRWAFEEQGLYGGAAPTVDVYIDDGRAGEYQFQSNFWNTTDIWVRNSADGGTAHQAPITDQPNYVYVMVRNRGSATASNVKVRAFHCIPGLGLTWPDDWQAMTTAEITVAGGVPAGGVVTVGPFEWTPTVVGHECILTYVSADDDLCNADPASGLASASGPIPHWRLVPFDNNIGQRNVSPVPGGGGFRALVGSFANAQIRVRNPYDVPKRVTLLPVLPAFLAERGWKLVFQSEGGGEFTLGARDARDVNLRLLPGAPFETADVIAAGEGAYIEIEGMIDRQLIGGQRYFIDAKLEKLPGAGQAPTTPGGGGGARCDDAAKKLLDCLDVPNDGVTCAQVKSVTIEIQLDRDCC